MLINVRTSNFCKANKFAIFCLLGDFIMLPAGIYHRLTLKNKSNVKMLRFFIWKPIWDLYNRPEADALDCRANYVESFVNDAEPSNSNF